MNEITCFMLYYGRRELAEESMESFLRQTYPHKKLLIVNTHPDPVWFKKPHPKVEVQNLKSNKFENLNEKYNYAMSQIKTQWMNPWDSDDIWLPWHLENLVANIDKVKDNGYPRKIGVPKSYFMIDGWLRIKWQMWGDCLFEVFDKNGNLYPYCDSNNIDNCDKQVTFQKWNRYWLNLDKYPISFIFRWDSKGKQTKHRSAKLGQQGIERESKMRQDMNRIKIKEPWRPHWKEDYVEKVKRFNETQSILFADGKQAKS